HDFRACNRTSALVSDKAYAERTCSSVSLLFSLLLFLPAACPCHGFLRPGIGPWRLRANGGFRASRRRRRRSAERLRRAPGHFAHAFFTVNYRLRATAGGSLRRAGV